MFAARSARVRTLSLLLTLALVVSLLLPALALPAAAATAPVMKGTVHDSSGAPVKDASVIVFSATQGYANEARTDGAGRYSISLAAGTVQVGASDEGHFGTYYGGATYATAKTITLTAGQTRAGIDMTMTAKPTTDVPGPGVDVAPRAYTRLMRKMFVRVAGDRALWYDGRDIVLAEDLGSGSPTQSVVSTFPVGAFDLGSSYAFIGGDRVDLASKATTRVISQSYDLNVDAVSCDDEWVAFLVSTYTDAPDGPVPSFALEIRSVSDPFNAAKSRRIPITADGMVTMSPGAVDNGRVAVTIDDSKVAVFSATTGATLRQFTVPSASAGSLPGAVLANDRLAWSDGVRAYVASMTSTPATRTFEDVHTIDGREIGDLVADGDRVGFWEDTWKAEDAYVDNLLKVVDVSTGTSSTPYSHAETLTVTPRGAGDAWPGGSGAYDVSGTRTIWLDKLAAPDAWGGGLAAGEEVWSAAEGGSAERADSVSFAPGEQSSPQLAAGRIAYLDNGAYPLDDYYDNDLKIANLDDLASAKVITTKLFAGYGDPVYALGDQLVAYIKATDPQNMGPGGDLYAYDIAGEHSDLVETAVDMAQIASTGRWVVYTSWKSSPALKVYDSQTKTRVQLVSGMDWDMSFRLQNGVVYYADADGIWSYDLATGTKKVYKPASGSWGGAPGPDAEDYPYYAYLEPTEGPFMPEFIGNFETGEQFVKDPLPFGIPTVMRGGLVLEDRNVFDMFTGEYYRLPLARPDEPYFFGGREGAIDGKLVASSSYDPATRSYGIKLFDLTDVIQKRAERIAGDNRVLTSVALSQDVKEATSVVIATARNFPDALAGVPLAQALKAPVLLTEPGALSPAVADKIAKLGAKKAYVLGANTAVSASVDASLVARGLTVERIAGVNRYDTAAKIALKLREVRGVPSISIAFVATGRSFPDALAASAVAARQGAPILLTDPKALPSQTAAALASLKVGQAIVLGDANAIGNGVVAQLPHPERLAGTDRWDTCRKVVDLGIGAGLLDAHSFVFAIGNDFPDALGGGALAARQGVPLLLVNRSRPSSLPAPIASLVKAKKAERTDLATIVGSEKAVPLQLEEKISQALW